MTTSAPSVQEDCEGWIHQSLVLTPGLTFMATAPKSRASDTEIRRGEAHGECLGLTYRRQNSIPKRTPPAFLLATSLTLSNRKMQEARERGLPVVLVADLLRCASGDCVQAHTWSQARSHGER